MHADNDSAVVGAKESRTAAAQHGTGGRSRRRGDGAPESDFHLFVRLLTLQLAKAPLSEVQKFLVNIGLNMPQSARAVNAGLLQRGDAPSTGLCRTHSSLCNTGDVLLAVYVVMFTLLLSREGGHEQ